VGRKKREEIPLPAEKDSRPPRTKRKGASFILPGGRSRGNAFYSHQERKWADPNLSGERGVRPSAFLVVQRKKKQRKRKIPRTEAS